MSSKPEEVEARAEVIEDGSISVTFSPAVLQANFDALEERVDAMVAEYEGAEYDLTDPEEVKGAKRDSAYLNSVKKEIEERRKAVEREFSKPLDEFKARCSQIVKKIDGARGGIKRQLDAAEEARRASKEAMLREHYGEFAELLAPVVPYERFHEPRWLNKTFSDAKARQELEDKVEKVAADWETLRGQKEGTAHYDTAEREFFRTLDLGAALSAARAAEDEDARIAGLKSSMARTGAVEVEMEGGDNHGTTERAYEPEPVPARAPQPAPAMAPEPAPVPPSTGREPSFPWVIAVESATRSQMIDIKTAMDAYGVHGMAYRGTVAEVVARKGAGNAR